MAPSVHDCRDPGVAIANPTGAASRDHTSTSLVVMAAVVRVNGDPDHVNPRVADKGARGPVQQGGARERQILLWQVGPDPGAAARGDDQRGHGHNPFFPLKMAILLVSTGPT